MRFGKICTAVTPLNLGGRPGRNESSYYDATFELRIIKGGCT